MSSKQRRIRPFRRSKPMTSIDLVVMGFVAALILSLGFPAVERLLRPGNAQQFQNVARP